MPTSARALGRPAHPHHALSCVWPVPEQTAWCSLPQAPRIWPARLAATTSEGPFPCRIPKAHAGDEVLAYPEKLLEQDDDAVAAFGTPLIALRK